MFAPATILDPSSVAFHDTERSLAQLLPAALRCRLRRHSPPLDSEMDIRNSSAGKRARSDGGRREDDWTCLSCGNVNFSFRMTCNIHSCNRSRPAHYNVKSNPKLFQTHSPYNSLGGYFDSFTPSSMYLGVPPYGSSLSGGSILPPYDMRYAGGSTYHYDYGRRISFGSPYGPLHISGPYPYSGGSVTGTGAMYGSPPPPLERFSLNVEHNALGSRSVPYPEESFQKKSAGRDNDWICPKCNNNNFSFRTVCNMRKCNTPRPGSQGAKSKNSSGSKSKMPEGSWKCDKCDNINYPFRTKCNRQNCGAERLSEIKANGLTSNEDDK